MHAISSYRGNRPTHKHTNPQNQTGPIEIHCAAKLSTIPSRSTYVYPTYDTWAYAESALSPVYLVVELIGINCTFRGYSSTDVSNR